MHQRNGHGTSVLGPTNKDRDRQNPDLVRPPSTDHGILPNLRWYGVAWLHLPRASIDRQQELFRLTHSY